MALHRFMALPRRSRNVFCRLFETHLTDLGPGASKWRGSVSASAAACRAILQSRADIIEFLATGDEEIAYRLRRRFGLAAGPGPAHPVPSDLFHAGAPCKEAPKATIIVPVHNAAFETARLLERLPATIAENQTVIVVNDRSSDPEIVDILDDFAQRHDAARIIHLPRNVGFVGAVTAGLGAVDPAHHVVLLNSDTLPPEDWLPRLLAPIAEDGNVASVTPFSTSAEILSIPRPGIASDLSERLVAELDRVAIRLRPRRVELPTGIGFCIAMNRTYIDRVGAFDPVFGRGYGEEVDWCLRAAAAGGRNLVATNLVVGHAGHASFGASEHAARVAKASRRIAALHPGYAEAALTWETRDPVGPERLAIALAWVASTSRNASRLFIAHSLGGGAEHALQHEIAASFSQSDDPVVILRVGGPALWRIEIQAPRFSISGDVDHTALLHELLAPILDRHVVYSCGVHSADPGSLPDTILRLAHSHRLDLRLHDFFIISPSWNLLGGDGRYRGVPEIGNRDPAHALAGLSHADWRDRWRQVISGANELTVFDRSGQQLIEETYPEARGKTVLRPHTSRFSPRRVATGGQTIGVLGGINRAKGGGVLEALASQGSRRIAVIGELDGTFRLSPPHLVHGRYDRSEIADLAAKYDVGAWLIPSVWPETFSFATREALSTGLPVACFDLGAQAEAVSKAANGLVLNCDPDDTAGIAAALERLFMCPGDPIRRP